MNRKMSMKKLFQILHSGLDFRVENYLDDDMNDFQQNDANVIDEHMTVYRLYEAIGELAVSLPFEYDVVDDKNYNQC